MSRPVIVADRDIPFLAGVLEPWFEVRYLAGNAIGPSDIRDAVALLVRTRTRCNASLLAESAVRFIGTATIGTDHIDTEYCASRGITVASAPGCNAAAVAQYVRVALRALALDRPGTTLGIIGVGHVGSLVAEVGRRAGMHVLLNDPPREAAEGKSSCESAESVPSCESAESAPSCESIEGHASCEIAESVPLCDAMEDLGHDGFRPSGFTPLPALLAASDVVTLHIPLWPENRDFADEAFFAAMKPGATFINASRGEVVDETALLAARPRLGHLVLDVWKNEPAINRALLAASDIATPHIAGYSIQGKINGTQAVVRALGEAFGIAPLRSFEVPGVPLPQTPYDIWQDDSALRRDPSSFESLRRHYSFRNDQL